MYGKLPKRLKFRCSQIAVNGVVFVLSLCACIPSGWTYNFFNFECILRADLSVTLNVKDNDTVILDWGGSTWGEPTQCLVSTYAPVVAAIHAFIWIWFYLQMKELDGNMQSLPALLFGSVLHSCVSLALLVCSGMLTVGLNRFCNNLQSKLQFSYHTYSCSELESMHWTTLKGTEKFYTYMKVSEISSWFIAVTSAILAVMNGYRAKSVIYKLQHKGDPETGSVLLRKGRQFGSSHFFLDDSSSIRSSSAERPAKIV
ncbi:transmembrane protein 179B-like isoform X1 [Ostrea edulis]|uniref:transmembrane protein 179B-like isoform X1 n=1 Tax=Ostrea edulis TaxID=37623 RepID=UPI0024AF91B5|nr:transmembrane protein 179B-like isoform X1 [Ostrea edulis]